jgi:transcriptional regulator GlxA family with amidase domain
MTSAGIEKATAPLASANGRSATCASARRRSNCASSSRPPSVQTQGRSVETRASIEAKRTVPSSCATLASSSGASAHSRRRRGVLKRLAELMFVELVRRHLETMPPADRGWLAGLRDPWVGRALALLHASPERRWDLAALARLSGTSRSVLAERFTRFVGEPPMQYLRAWRVQLAGELLAAPRPAKLAAVAEAVGYESEASFSRAFKRSVGAAPGRMRRSLGRRAGSS